MQQRNDRSSIMYRITSFWKRVQNTEDKRLKDKGPPVVGTQAVALEHIQKNSKHFKYPKEGFSTPIEHSLLYSMINTGIKVYPEDIVLKHIDDEDFNVYLYQSNNIVSYAQLGAILALSIEKFPPSQEQSISQKLTKNVLTCITKYAEDNDLDRQAEIKEFLDPVQEYSMKRANQAEIPQLLTFYVGYTASLMTANPIPMLLGLTALTAANDKVESQRRNISTVTEESSRRADVEKTSLLDEQDF